jgi:hypothetical protein
MNSNHNSVNLQHRINTHTESLDSKSFFNLLTSPQLFSTVERLQPEFRERNYPPTDTLSMFLSQAMSADRSCQNIVNITQVQRLVNGLPQRSTHTGSYCKARKRLPTSLVAELVRCTGQLIDDQLPTDWRWHGRPVRLIDGTTVMMPDTPENQTAYPQQAGQKTGLGFPICRMVGIICLASSSVMNAAIGPFKGKGTDEQTLLRTMLDTLMPETLLWETPILAVTFYLQNYKGAVLMLFLNNTEHVEKRRIFEREKNGEKEITWSPIKSLEKNRTG